ncbi:MAG: sugar phosphate isomerase/epimerase [Lachnospiraceae bacterium]|nr:sugar phosphate isomerase/epimerase [Lachnospiraceae bacterium]
MSIGVQTKNVVYDANPAEGFAMMKRAGFSCADFSLNSYLLNTSLYRFERNDFFSMSDRELEVFFKPHKDAAKAADIEINQMHMPYPNYVPGADTELNDYLWQVVAPKSLKICAYFGCRNIVIHGFKLAYHLGLEEAEWEETAKFLDFLAPMAKEMGITVCIENLYNSKGGHLVEGPCCNAWKAVERIDYFNDKYHAQVLGFCFDTGHANLVGIDFEDFITALDYRLKVLHIHDNDGIQDLHQIPYTFTKTRENIASTDWEGFLSGLRRIQYKGALSFETAPVLAAFPDELKEEALRLIAKIGKYFDKEIKD